MNQELLKELLIYYPNTGIFEWKARSISHFTHCKFPERAKNNWNARMAGKNAGCVARLSHGYFYLYIGIKRKLYRAHIIAWIYSFGSEPAFDIDHEDGDKLNNKICNLRDVSHCDNQKNMKMPITNSSGFVGVVFRKDISKWQSQIQVAGKLIYGGVFENINDAIEKRKQMNVQYGFHKNHGRL